MNKVFYLIIKKKKKIIIIIIIIIIILLLFFSRKGGRYSRRWLFQTIFAGSRALMILFYYPIKSKSDHIK